MGKIPYRPAIPVTKRTPPLAGAPATLQRFTVTNSPQGHRGVVGGRQKITGNPDMRPTSGIKRAG